MSTVDLQTAFKVAAGEYTSDNWEAIIIYKNMFGGISFKLCSPGTTLRLLDEFANNKWPREVVWQANQDDDFTSFKRKCRQFVAQFPGATLD